MSWHNWHAVSAFITRSKIWRIVTAGACCRICSRIARIRVFQALRVIKARATWLPRNILTQAAFITHFKTGKILTTLAAGRGGCAITFVGIKQTLCCIHTRTPRLSRYVLTLPPFITCFKIWTISTTLTCRRHFSSITRVCVT